MSLSANITLSIDILFSSISSNNADKLVSHGLNKGHIINIRNGENLKASRHVLIDMLEKLLSQMNTVELEGRMQTTCNLSENIEALSYGYTEKELLQIHQER